VCSQLNARREEEWEFEFLKSRINTRENSTLMFSTVAVSVSLLFLSLIIGQENSINIGLLSLYFSAIETLSSNNLRYLVGVSSLIYQNWQSVKNLLFWTGLITIASGISYREITIFFTDREDYKRLKNIFSPPELSNISIIRSLLVRLFFFSSLIVWLCVYPSNPTLLNYYNQILISNFILRYHLVGLVIFLLVFLTIVEFLLRE